MEQNKIIIIAIAAAIIAVIVFEPKSTILTLLIGLAAGLIPAIVTNEQRQKEREEDYDNWLMQNKEACAIELVKILMDMYYNNVTKDIYKREHRIKSAILVWGSPDIIKQLDDLENITERTPHEDTIRIGEKLLRTVRKDLGKDDSTLAPGALIAAIMSGVEGKQKVYDICKGEKYD